MTPKITDEMAEEALAAGGREKREVQPPPPSPPKIPIPEPAQPTDFTPLTGAIGELVAQLQEQLNVAQAQLQALQQQNEELRSVAAAMMAEKPVRLKVTRDMDRDSRTFLLMKHIDVVPVTYTRKLNS